MQATRCTLRLLLLTFSLVIPSLFAAAQVVLTTLPVGQYPDAVAVNPVTDKIYVLNDCGNDPSCQSSGTVTVIDGATNGTQTVNVGSNDGFESFNYGPVVAVNPMTNKIYVANGDQSVTVIDGVTNGTATIQVGNFLGSVAVNSVTNRIYVSQSQGSTLTVIDGATNNILTTITVQGSSLYTIAVNTMTNKVYAAGAYNSGGQGNVTVIDGSTNNIITTIATGYNLAAIAVNPVTNKIYVANRCGNDPSCQSAGTVTVIDGATNNTQTVTVGYSPEGVGVNSNTNKIYAENVCADQACFNGSVTAIDGATNNTTTISNAPVGGFQAFSEVVVDSQSNKVYSVRGGSGVSNVLTAVDGTKNTALTLGAGDVLHTVAVNENTHRVYVPKLHATTVTIVAGDAKLQFVPATPCRVVDTRNPNGPFGGPPIQGGSHRDFPLPQGGCNIPATAVAYALNITVVPHGRLGYLTIWPSSQSQPSTSTMNSLDGRVKANAAIVQGGVSAAVSVYATDTTDVILDINGYFAPSNNSSLAFFPLAPCRVADTRKPEGPLGGPSLNGGQERDFPILDAASCDIPDSAQAYSFNFTAVPHGPLGYLTVWPAGQSRPVVSTLNAPTGTIVANAAIVPAGTGGEIAVYSSNDTDLLIDINGYFAPSNAGYNPLSFYTLQACRALDTRSGDRGGWFSGEFVADILDAGCAVSDQAEAYLFNATAIPRIRLGYLTLWPDGESQPLVSTLNAIDGAITSNMAIVPNIDGFTDAYNSDLSQLLLDISGYFAP